MQDSPLVVLYDATGNLIGPVTGKPNTALNNNQGGVYVLGSDYGTTTKGQFLKVDANGSVATVPSTATTGAVAPNSSATTPGTVLLAELSASPVAAQMDAWGNISAQPAPQATFTVNAPSVTNASGKSLLALMNKSTSSVLRLVAVYAQNSGTNPSALTTYAIFVEQLTFITGLTGGTALTPISHDTVDSLSSGITCATGGTVSGEISPAIRRWVTSSYPLAPGSNVAEDTVADEQGRFPWVSRADPTAKLITIRPGYGVNVSAPSSGSNGGQTLTFVFTQSAA